MKDIDKTKEQLISELTEMRQRVDVLETSESEWRQAEKELQGNYENFRAIFENLNNVIIRLDKYGKIVEVNGRLKSMFGYEPDEVIGKNFTNFNLFSIQELPKMVKLFADGIRGKVTRFTEVEIRRKDGSTFFSEISTGLARRNDKIEGMIAVVRDITERKQMEKMLQQSEEKWRSLVENAPNLIMLTDCDCKIQFINRTVSGISANDVIGKSIYDYILPGYHDTARKVVKRVLESGKIDRYEIKGSGPDGSVSWYETMINPVKSAGEVVGMIHIISDITEHKQVEEALKESEEKSRVFMETATDLMNITDKDGKFTYVNDSMARTLGYSKEELLVMHITQILSKESLEKDFKPNWGKFLADGEMSLETTLLTKEGEEIYCEIKAVAVYDSDGNYVGSRAVHRDITEHKRMEMALQESEERYRSLLNLGGRIGEAIIMLQDTEKGTGIHTFVSEEWARLTGYSEEELLGMSMLDLIHPRDRDGALERHKMRMQGKSIPELIEITIIRKDGIEVPVEVTGAYTTYKGKRASVIYIRDITERKRAEYDLNERMKELRCLYSIANIAEKKGITLDEIYQETANLLPAGWQYPEVACARIALGNKEFKTDNFKTTEWKQSAKISVGERKEGTLEVRYLEAQTETGDGPFLKEERQLIDAVAERLGRITERLRARQELQEKNEQLDAQNEELQSQSEELMAQQQEVMYKTKELEETNVHLQEVDRLKSIFLASMSHELRTPLNSIIGFTSLILQGMVGEINEEQKNQLTYVNGSANHLLSLINDILDISKIEAGKVEFELEEFRLGDVATEVVGTFSATAKLKGIRLLMDISEDTKLFSDKRRLKQVLMNLVSNAIKFTDRGSVKVTSRIPADDNLEISVIDTGIGIKKEDIGKLFAPFQQIDDSLTKKHAGTGLGLYISRKIGTLLGGDISVKSEYGRGSEFTFTLPMHYVKEQRNAQSTSSG